MVIKIFTLLCAICSMSYGQETHRSIQEVADGLYRVTSGPYHSMYWVTDMGIVVLDTIDTDTARWLRDEIATRHDQAVRYVVYSHNHFDHVLGGEIFDEPGTVFVSHEHARNDMARTKLPTRIPDLTFSDAMSLHLGEEELRLRYHGTNNGRGSVSMHFVDHRVMFVVDWIVIGRMPYRELEGYDIEGMIRSTREVLTMDWDTLVGGHAEIGTHADVEHYLSYLESLYASVRDGMLAGKSLEVLQAEIRLDAFSDLTNYEAWLPLNIAGVYRTLADRSYMLTRPDTAQDSP